MFTVFVSDFTNEKLQHMFSQPKVQIQNIIGGIIEVALVVAFEAYYPQI